jgi:hypothetical protein
MSLRREKEDETSSSSGTTIDSGSRSKESMLGVKEKPSEVLNSTC